MIYVMLYIVLLAIISTFIYHFYINNLKLIDFKLVIFKELKKYWKYLLFNIVICTSIELLMLFRYENDLFSSLKIVTLISLLEPVAIIDYKEKIIPNKMLVIALIFGIVLTSLQILFGTYSILDTLLIILIGIAVICGLLLIISLIYKDSIGMGDIKLLAVMCVYEGLYGALNTLIVSLLVCFIYAIYLLITKKANKKTELSFGLFLYIGLILTSIMGVS